MRINKNPKCTPCPDKQPPLNTFLGRFYRDLFLSIRTYRDGMSGRLDYRYIKEYIQDFHEYNDFTKAFIQNLPALESIELDWQDRGKPKKT